MHNLSKLYSSKNNIKTENLRCWLEINLSNLRNNIKNIKSIISNKSDIICVLNTNLGLINIAKYLTNLGIKYFAVSNLYEAIELRCNGIKGEIIILNWTPISEKETLIKYNLTQTLIDYDYAIKLNQLPKIVKCHIKIDIGMNIFGFKIDDVQKIKNCYNFENLKIEGIFSELYLTREFNENVENYIKIQINNFDDVINKLKSSKIKVGITYLMNSLGLLRFKNKYDLVKIGLLMYDIFPFSENKNIEKLLKNYNFKPIVSLKSKIISVKYINKGDKVGYNSIYIANERTKIATISIGYADGLSFCSSKNELNVIVKDNLCPIIGNICMDCSIIKIPLNSDIKEGEIVTLFGYHINKNIYLNFKEFISKSEISLEELISFFSFSFSIFYFLIFSFFFL